MLKSKTSMNLLGVFVIALLVWALLNFWYMPVLGRFSCSYTPWFLGQAQAATDEGCPSGIREIMDDPKWAADRWEEVQGKYRTTGLYYDANGKRHTYDSRDEKGPDAERANKILREVGARSDRAGRFPAATHVEVKVAAIMRENGNKLGVAVINHPSGPCPGGAGLSCQEVLPMVLAPGSTLRVWWKQDNVMRFQDFTGR